MTPRNQDIKEREHSRYLSRVALIHREISSGRCPRACDLAQQLECSGRTVMRDIAYLRDQLKAPLIYDRARGGWRYTELGWDFAGIPLTEGELVAFFVGEQALQATGQAPEAQLLRTGLAKLAARLPEIVSISLTTLGEALSFQQTPHVAVAASMLQTLSAAAAERRTIRFDYYSPHRDEHTTRTADILLLHNFAGDWYAIAYDHERADMRDFHAGRITHIHTTDNYFEPPIKWHKDDYLRRGFSMMRGGRLTTVSIVFDEYQARWMRERANFHPDEVREDLPGGEMRLCFPVGASGLEAVARFVCGYAGHARAERPRALRILIRERLTSALQQHEGA